MQPMQIACLDKRLSCPIKDESAAQRQMSGTQVWRSWFLKWDPEVSVMLPFMLT